MAIRWLDAALRVETQEKIAIDQWQHISVSYDGSRVASGVKIYINGQPRKLRVQLDMLNQSFATKQPFRLGKELSGTDIELDHGDKLFRRSLYTFWKRTSPQPTMTVFDALGSEMCSVRPTRTDTPLQALALMNDITFGGASRNV